LIAVEKVANHLLEHNKQIVQELIKEIVEKSTVQYPQEEIDRGRAYFEEFFIFLAKKVSEKGEDTDLINWSRRNGETEANLGNKLTNILKTYEFIRDSFLNKVYAICSTYKLSTEDTFIIIKKLDKIIDIALHETIRSFDHFKDKLLQLTKEEINELSAPIVPLDNGIAVLPIVGRVDSFRAKFILEKIVPKAAGLNIQKLIIDFSGILAVDTMVVDHLFKIHHVLRLLGVETLVTGIRPAVAHTTVKMDIDLSSIKTYSTVKHALEEIHKPWRQN
jgi:rsbT co-antagonist protein RsbR